MSSLRCGIVGLPNVGKSTLFNALLKKRVALSANYPFATVEPNVGVVAVPDDRLEKLAELIAKEEGMIRMDTPGVEARKYWPPIIPAVVEFVDIAGLAKGAHAGEGLGNQFLSHIREVDAIVHVLRDFQDESVVRAGAENPDADKLTVETELGLADLQTLDKLVVGQDKEAKATKDPLENQKLVILKRMTDDLGAGRVMGGSFDYAQGFRDERLTTWFSHLPLLSLKPCIYVYNVLEDEYGQKLHDRGKVVQADRLVISAKLEEELADLSEEERVQYLKGLGIEETGLERLIKAAYKLLGLISFLTAGKKEVRAWTLRRGFTALRASGVIHTDFMKNFIRAQVIEYEKLIEAGSYGAAKLKGWVRTEGKEYVVSDGDVVEFLVSK